jgi:hypothetical protein
MPACCVHGGEMTRLALRIRQLLKPLDGLQFEPRNTSDVDRQVRPLIPRAAVSPPLSF